MWGMSKVKVGAMVVVTWCVCVGGGVNKFHV